MKITYPHDVNTPVEPYDHGFVVGYAEASAGQTLDPDLAFYEEDFGLGYVAGRRAHALMHVSRNETGHR